MFEKQTAEAMEQWLATIKNEDDLKKIEAQGIDMSQYRDKLEKQWAAQDEAKKLTMAARYGIGDFNPASLANPINLDKLEPYKAVPRDVSSQFVLDSAGKPPLFGLFGKDKHYKSVADAQLVYAAVVQAHYGLWEPNDDVMGMVLVFATDEAHCYNVPWLKKTAKAISDMKESATVPADCVKFIDVLRDDESRFEEVLGSSLSDGATAMCITFTVFETSVLPKTYLPSEGIVPLLLKSVTTENDMLTVDAILVPAKYYTN